MSDIIQLTFEEELNLLGKINNPRSLNLFIQKFIISNDKLTKDDIIKINESI